jgi:hypothetical protein
MFEVLAKLITQSLIVFTKPLRRTNKRILEAQAVLSMSERGVRHRFKAGKIIAYRELNELGEAKSYLFELKDVKLSKKLWDRAPHPRERPHE